MPQTQRSFGCQLCAGRVRAQHPSRGTARGQEEEMGRSGILAVSFAAALTVGAGAAASASAEAPEYGRCVNVAVLGKVGAFKNSGCTVRATASEHKFEWEPGPGAKPKFSSHMTSEKATIETEIGTRV